MTSRKSSEVEPKYRQPRVFGPLPGPRNIPFDKRHLPDNMTVTVIAASALSDATALAALLPPRCRLLGEPVLNVSVAYLRNIGWLAGRGYNILSLDFAIVFDGEGGQRTGKFTPVLWESMADPIMTGREELGFAKLYAQIPEPIVLGDAYHATASWEGFRFFDLDVSDLAEGPLAVERAALDGSFHHRFMPKVGAQGEADAEYMVFIPGAGGPGSSGITKRLVGRGAFRFTPARWEDVPLQYPIINALADLLAAQRFRGASVSFLDPRAARLRTKSRWCDDRSFDNPVEDGMTGVRRVVTGHDEKGHAVIASDRSFEPLPIRGGIAAFAKLRTTNSSPADNGDKIDGAERESGLTCPEGTVLRIVDMAPGNASPMHKTNSIDYGIVLTGEIEMRLDSGETTRLKPGDIVVQRGTNHAWVNVGGDWARMAFAVAGRRETSLGDGAGVTP